MRVVQLNTCRPGRPNDQHVLLAVEPRRETLLEGRRYNIGLLPLIVEHLPDAGQAEHEQAVLDEMARHRIPSGW